MKNSRFSSFVEWGNSISNRFVFVGKLELLTKFVGALLFVVALGGNAMGQNYILKALYGDGSFNFDTYDCNGNGKLRIEKDNFYNGFYILKNGEYIDINVSSNLSICVSNHYENCGGEGKAYKYNNSPVLNGWLIFNFNESTPQLDFYPYDESKENNNEPQCGPSTPYIKVPNGISILQNLNADFVSMPISAEIKNCDECSECGFSYTLNGDDVDKFEIVESKIKLKSNDKLGDYKTTVIVKSLCNTLDAVEIPVTAKVCEWPKCYTLNKSPNGTFDICTDENGDLIIDLDASPFKDFKGTLTIPSDLEIVCNNFKIYGGKDNYEFKLINSGLIHCESDCSIGIEGKTLGSSTIDGNAIFVNGSTGSIIANNIDVRYRYAMPNFEGSWISTKNINILNGQGQDLHFLDDCTIQANELKIQCNISNAVIIEGDLIVDNIESSKKIYVESDGELTVGDITKIPWAASVIIKENGTLNLCSNPTLNSADDLGFIIGTVLYNIAAWPDTNPFEEQDINKSDGSESWMWNSLGGNSDWSPKSLIGAYKNYEDCMLKKADPSFLGIDDDPFLPKQKEIKHLYNYNPCDDETLYKFQYGPEIYRIFEQHFIRCEKDNKR